MQVKQKQKHTFGDVYCLCCGAHRLKTQGDSEIKLGVFISQLVTALSQSKSGEDSAQLGAGVGLKAKPLFLSVI